MRSNEVIRPLALCSLWVLSACGGGGDSPDSDARMDALVVLCGSTTLEVTRTTRCSASALDAQGQTVELSDPTWSTSDGRLARVDAAGGVRALAKGEVLLRVKATVDGVSKQGETPLTVNGTLHTEDITAHETWQAADNPHVLGHGLVVGGASNPSLTLEAGVVVRFARGAGLYVGGFSQEEPGSLVVEGTETAPVLLTSHEDNPQQGDWSGVVVKNATTSSSIRHAIIEYAGSDFSEDDSGTGFLSLVGSLSAFGNRPGESEAPPLFIETVTVRKNKAYGVYLSGVAFAPGSTGLVVSDSAKPAAVLSANELGSLPMDSVFTGNLPNAVDIVPGGVTRSQTWRDLGVPYRLLRTNSFLPATLSVGGASQPTLTLAPGTEFQMSSESAFVVGGAGESGSLVVEGTGARPIRFVADSSTPSPGFWAGLYFVDAQGSRLDHVLVSHAGAPLYTPGAGGNLDVSQELGPFVTHSTFSGSSGCGLTRDPALVTTDFTRAEYGNTFADNAEGAQCEK